jgi:hypothetical protein
MNAALRGSGRRSGCGTRGERRFPRRSLSGWSGALLCGSKRGSKA